MFMKTVVDTESRAGERGAVHIKTVLLLVALGVLAFVALKVAPVYIEQRKVTAEVEELARISSVRNYKEDEIKKRIEKLRNDFSLPEGSINLAHHAENNAQITVKYNKQIDFLLTTYTWQVNYTASGKGI
jgi:Flp pilus assembly protein TadG